mgnify:CR=1 FL=1
MTTLLVLLILGWPASFLVGVYTTRYLAKKALKKVLKEIPQLRVLMGGQMSEDLEN